MTTHITPAELTEMAAREESSAAIVAAWSRPDPALVLSILATHGPQAAEFVRSVADYQVQRAAAGGQHAANYHETGGAIRAALDAYNGTEATSSASLGSITV